MNTKKIALVSILVCLMFVLYNTRQVNKNSNNPEQKNGDTALAPTQDYPESSAITKARDRLGQNSRFVLLRKEASQFGLALMSWEEDEYRKIRDRLFSNNKLASTIKTVSQEGILVALGNRFQVNTQDVEINIDATDNEIIKFLVGSLLAAKARKASFEGFRKEASQFGLALTSWEEDEYQQIRNRLLTNDELASALKAVAREEIQVGLSHNFRIGVLVIDINVDASDEEIIKFLLGK